MSKLILKTNFAVDSKYGAYFTGKRVQVTKDGTSLLCENDKSVGVVSLETGKVTGRIPFETDVITCISLAPDDSSLIVALRSSSVQQYQWPSLELQRSFRSYHQGPVQSMNWDASSTLLITGGSDSSARVWDIQQKFCTHNLKGASGIFGVVMFHPDLTKKPHAYGAVTDKIHIWALAAGSSTVVATLDGHHSKVTTLQMTADTKHLVSCGLDRVIILWDLETYESKKVVPAMESLSGMILQPEGLVFPGAKADDGHVYVLTVGDKGIPSVWQVDNARQVWKAPSTLLTLPDSGEGAAVFNQALFSPALESVVITTYDHSILFAKVDTVDVWKQLSGYNDQILDAIFVGTGDSHLLVATNSPQFRIYNVKNFSCHLMQGHTANVYSLSRHSTQHSLFATSSHDGSIRLWNLKSDGSAVCVALALGHTQSVGSVALSQDFMVTGSSDMCVKRWNIKQISEVGIIDMSEKKNMADSIISLTSTHTEKAHDKDINTLCISVNHKLIASGSQDKSAKIWDSNDLSLLGVLHGHRRGIWNVQFSPVDEVLATASGDGTIKIWTLNDFKIALTLEGQGFSVMGLSWISQGQQLLSIDSEGLLKMWTLKTRQCVQTWDEHDSRLWALAVSQDESVLVTGGEGATIVVWKDVSQEEKEKEVAEAARLAAEEQVLSNLIQDKKWAKALGIAIRLGQPYKALKITKSILDDDPEQLPKILRRFRHDQLVSILQFASQWNTKTKNSREAQTVLSIVLSSKTPEEMEDLEHWKQLLEGLLPYTERHFRRLSALHQSSSILQYMSSSVSLGGNVPLGAESKPLDNLELLRTISEFPSTKDDDEEDEGVDVNEGSEDEEEGAASIRAAIKDSVMEVSENDDDEESDNEMYRDDLGRNSKNPSGRTKVSATQGKSLDDLDDNFVLEKIVAESSDEGDM